MGFLINPYNFAAGGVGGWVELGRTTLGSAAASINVSSLADKRYLMVLMDHGRTGTGSGGTNLNGDTGSNYAFRYSSNGGADSTGVSDTRIFNQGNGGNVWRDFMVSYMANYSTKEKLVIEHLVENQNGAANAPDRFETFGKHAQTSNPISSVQQTTNTTYNTGSEIVVLGWDPADTHTSNFWEEIGSASGTGCNDVTLTASKKYLWVQFFGYNTGTGDHLFRVGSGSIDSGSNYAKRISFDGGADSTASSQNNLSSSSGMGAVNKVFFNAFIINNSANEKLMIMHHMERANDGAGTAPNRSERVAKWANTSAQINHIGMQLSANSWNSESIIKVWGSD